MTLSELKYYMDHGCTLCFYTNNIRGGITSYGTRMPCDDNVSIRCDGDTDFQNFRNTEEALDGFMVLGSSLREMIPKLDFEFVHCY